ncbi:MAG: helicase C-terminal domain-containing protein [Candidatus Latescibacterota bacterium]
MNKPDTFVSVDIETTGLDSGLHEIIEIGAVRVEAGKITAEFSELVKPERQLPEYVTRLTGITERDLRNAGTIRQALPSFLDFVAGYKVVGQNIGFDVSFLRTAAGLGNFGAPVDTGELARILLPMLSSYSLDSLIEFFALTAEVRHRALPDARVTAEVFLKLLDMVRLLPDSLLSEMTRISSRTGSGLLDLFQAQLMERTNAPLSDRGKSRAPGAATGQPDNLFGDFTREPRDHGDNHPKVDERYVESLLCFEGGLSKHHEAFEERPGQISLAKRIARSFNCAEVLLAEAGTGIGKSIAYLLPAILFSESARERVIVSTNTKNLQEQLFFKDIPLLSTVLDFPFRAVILKGRGNYLCLNRWQRFIDTPEQFLTKQERGLVLPVAAWLHSTITGDLSETGFFSMLGESGLMDRINSETVSCLGARCPHRDQCFVNRVRRAAQRAHIIIVNHSLVFSDMVSEGAVLGGYSRIIFDEAHNLERVAMRFLGVSFSYYRIRRVLNHLFSKSDGSHGILAVLDTWAQEMVKGWPEYEAHLPLINSAVEGVQAARTITQGLFERIHGAVQEVAAGGESNEGKLRYYPESPVFLANSDIVDEFRAAVVELLETLGHVYTLASGVSPNLLPQKEDLLIDLEKSRTDLLALVNDLDFLVAASGRNVFWFEFNEDGKFYSLKIQSAPLDVAEKLAAGLYDHMETVIMTSATLTVANDFTYIRDRLGLNLDSRERVTEFIASSPFDYQRQAAVIVPAFVPSPKEGDFIRRTNEVLLSMADELRRGMLVLFTSRGHLYRSYHDLRDQFAQRGITLLAQGVDGSRNLLLRKFREDVSSVLFGMDSFWEGVDVPGSALELVVIVRLPFAVPSDPIVQAQMEEVERAGKNSFTCLSVPEAAIKLRQGAGRLIRHRNDRGAVVILDKRVSATWYGQLFRRSLPGRNIRAESAEMLIENLRGWFASEGETIPEK